MNSNYIILLMFLLVWLLVNPLVVYAVERSRNQTLNQIELAIPILEQSWLEKCETCIQFEMVMEQTECKFDFDQIIDVSQTDMPLENKKEVIAKMVDEFFECALPEQEEEVKNQLITSLLLDLTLQGEKSDKQSKLILEQTKIINDKTDRVIELEKENMELHNQYQNQSILIAIVFVAIGIFAGILIQRYVKPQKSIRKF